MINVTWMMNAIITNCVKVDLALKLVSPFNVDSMLNVNLHLTLESVPVLPAFRATLTLNARELQSSHLYIFLTAFPTMIVPLISSVSTLAALILALKPVHVEGIHSVTFTIIMQSASVLTHTRAILLLNVYHVSFFSH